MSSHKKHDTISFSKQFVVTLKLHVSQLKKVSQSIFLFNSAKYS